MELSFSVGDILQICVIVAAFSINYALMSRDIKELKDGLPKIKLYVEKKLSNLSKVVECNKVRIKDIHERVEKLEQNNGGM